MLGTSFLQSRLREEEPVVKAKEEMVSAEAG
jgi:hypothetical protein